MPTDYDYTTEIIENLEKSISSERFSTYLNETSGNKEEALQLYWWNSKVSAEFYIPLQGLEITLRNSLHQVCTDHFGAENWYETAPLDRVGGELVDKAKWKVQRLHQTITPPHVVAELSFGFWLSLLNKQYHQSFWIPFLHKAFPHASKPRAEIHRTLDHLRLFRNRIAHHEPIFSRHLAEDYQSIMTTVSWICPVTADWIDHHNNVIEALAAR